MIVFGALLASVSPTGDIDFGALLVVLLVINTGATLRIMAQRRMRIIKVDGGRIDSINIRIWNLLLSTIIFMVMITIIDYSSIVAMWSVGLDLIIITLASMLITFFARITYIRALGIGRPSITQAVTALTVIFGVVATVVINTILPGVIPPILASPIIFIIKVIGTIMVALGIVTLALSEVKAYILIKAPRGKGIYILKALSKIKGVVVASALAGEFDYIVKVKLRALGKAYRRVIRAIEKIDGIEVFIWLSTLYEWEEV